MAIMSFRASSIPTPILPKWWPMPTSILPDARPIWSVMTVSRLLDRPISRGGCGRRCHPLAGNRAGPRRARLSIRTGVISARVLDCPAFIE